MAAERIQFKFKELSITDFVTRLVNYGFTQKGNKLVMILLYQDCQLTYTVNLPNKSLSKMVLIIESNVENAPIKQRAKIIIKQLGTLLNR